MPLHLKILLGMALGLAAGAAVASLGAESFVVDWVKPFGEMFLRALKMLAIPLVVASLVKGVSDMGDLRRLSALGGRTVALFLCTTAASVALGLLLVNLVQPGRSIDPATREKLVAAAGGVVEGKLALAKSAKDQGPLQPLVDVVPENVFAAASTNGSMLQVIFFVLLFGVGLLLVAEEKGAPVKLLFNGLNEVVMKLIDLVMLTAPVGVFALLASLVAETPSWDVFRALLLYSATVLAGIAILLFGMYPALVWFGARMSFGKFSKGIAPAQLLAFSTSSSAATLPVTMECVQDRLGVDEEVASFVLPIGATVNMDGTSLYQAVAAVFIAQAMGIELTLVGQSSILLTATLASIGTAAVPSAGIVMLVIVLGTIGVPEQGIALIIAVDRVLDMFRTVANVTSDAAVSVLVAKSAGLLQSR
jgi:Na+/H+-dicarboxylate symporter